MPGPKPNKRHDDLDALLDGRPVELTDELVPLVEAADALRVELASYEFDPEVADRHLARVLGRVPWGAGAPRYRLSSAAPPGVVDCGPVKTLDGVEILLRANVELPTEFHAVSNFGACGVGLFRSEFLLSRPGLMTSDVEQYETYKLLAEAAGEYGAIVRLFDVGGEVGPDVKDRERNPALGLRAVRFNLRHKDIMRTQVRAILRAAAAGRRPRGAGAGPQGGADARRRGARTSRRTRGSAP